MTGSPALPRGILATGSIVSVHSTVSPAGVSDSFVTAPLPELALDATGIPGDRHAGSTRAAGPREPWLPKGLSLRNDRQLSALSQEELALIAAGLKLPALDPGLIGANLVTQGIADLSRLPPGSHLAIGGNWSGQGRFDGHTLLRVEAYNRPCRGPGRKLAAAHGRPDLEFAFVTVARSLRGLVLSVAHPGVIRPGDAVVVIAPLLAP
ncbi:MAG: MOSC domain-containing protein [Beijerinckiaceae bacterium]|jgi:hypothetical protein|nr:MOSC domain-containing protein [Beijerinckiaceae bacterium]